MRQQSRDFLTYIYGVVFVALTVGYVTTDAIELVDGRGAVPRLAPWALTHAVAGLTAFGQLITAFVVASAGLRDGVLRTDAQVRTTRVSDAQYFAGRLMGALGVMVAVYACIPLGLAVGVAVGGDALPWGSLVRAVALFVVPNVLVVSALFYTVSLVTRRVGGVAVLGVSLVVLWQIGVAWTRDGMVGAAWIDPFGNAMLERVTATWDVTTRMTEALPVGPFVAHRLLWVGIAALALVVGWRWRDGLVVTRAPARRVVPAVPRLLESPRAPQRTTWFATLGWTARGTLRLLWREPGLLILAAIGLLNVLSHAWRVPRTAVGIDTLQVLSGIDTHFQLFAILLATIYAGELVWRDRDVRIAPLIDALGAAPSAVLAGRVLATSLVFVAISVALGAGAVLAEFARGDAVVAWGAVLRYLSGDLLPWWLSLFVLGVALHVVVRHKVAAHFVLIATWVAVVAVAG
jgi:hypothetical protein